MKASVVHIGSSWGSRTPRRLLDQSRLARTVDLEVRNGELVIRPANKPRSGWEDAFRHMADQGDDVLLEGKSLSQTKWDRTEWKW